MGTVVFSKILHLKLEDWVRFLGQVCHLMQLGSSKDVSITFDDNRLFRISAFKEKLVS